MLALPEPGEDLRGQVVGDRPVVPGELPHDAVGVVGPRQRERRHAHAGGPALGPVDDRAELGLAEDHAVVGEDPADLLALQREVADADLAEAARQSQPVQPEHRVPAAGQHRVQAVGELPEQRLQVGEHVGRLQLLHVVEQQPHRGARGRQQAAIRNVEASRSGSTVLLRHAHARGGPVPGEQDIVRSSRPAARSGNSP